MCSSEQPQDGAGSRRIHRPCPYCSGYSNEGADAHEPTCVALSRPRRLTVLVAGGTAVWVEPVTCKQLAPESGVHCVRQAGHFGTHEGMGGTRWT